MKTVNILDYGAIVSDLLQTAKIQKAIDDCFLAGGGKVIVPCGVFRVGCIRLRSNVALYLESGAILEGSRNPDDYFSYLEDELEPICNENPNNIARSVFPFSEWNNAIIRVIDAENVSIIGEVGSYIDGVNCYNERGEEGYRGPHTIDIQNSRNIYLKGYTIRNSGNWAHAIFCTSDINVEDVTVYGGHDGFDIRTCDNTVIENCKFFCGDDAIAGFDNIGVVIRNCYLNSSCSNLRFGGTNVLVQNCKMIGPGCFAHRYALSLEKKKSCDMTDESCRRNTLTGFLYYCDYRAKIRETPGNIVIDNCEFEDIDTIFDLPFDNKEIWCCNRSLSSIVFKNCRVKNVKKPIFIRGDEKEKLSMTLENMDFSATNWDKNTPFIEASNYQRIYLKDVRLQNFESPYIKMQTKGEIKIEDSASIDIKSI